MLFKFIDIILHIDKYLLAIVQEFSLLTYALIFLIIVLETGLVITPFFPGDSLLFTAGALAAMGSFNIWLLFIIIFVAAVLGDTLNYQIGKYVGPKVFKKESSLLFHKEHLVRAQVFYQKYGKKTVILARFIPIIRTFVPFVAGIGTMSYNLFLLYNVIGALIWSIIFLFSGYLFGNIPWVKEHFGLMVIAIIIISLLPLIKEVIFHFFTKEKQEAVKQNETPK